MDPNEITGYFAESGSLAVSAEQMQMPYMIEFENDTMFATAPAHKVVVKDTLDGEVFDLDSFSATSFGFGGNLEMINGEQSFIRFVDMRPANDVIAQVQLDYRIDTTFAVATWTFLSLDTMTMLPIIDPSLGFLPINFNGDGVGEVHFTINRKAYLPDSTFIRNRAWITFDNEAPIPTSVWTNIVDNTPPEGQLVTFKDSIGERRMRIVASDNLSGIWRYDLYGEREDVGLLLNAYIPADSSILKDSSFDYDSYYSIVSDSAGNKGKALLFIPQYNVTALCADSTMGTIDGAGSYAEGDIAVLTANANCGFHFLQWADNVTENPRQVVVHSDTMLIAVFEADSSVVLFETQCDSYTWQNGITYTSSGTYFDTLTNEAGCDSIVTLYLTINSPVHTAITENACNNYLWNGNLYSQSGDYTYSHADANGCMRVDTLHLTINTPSHTAMTETTCGSFTWNGMTYVASGDYTYSHADANGCTQVDTLHLTIIPADSANFAETACDSYVWNDSVYTQSGDYSYTYIASNGCDSVVTLHLTINTPAHAAVTETACDNFTWNGMTYLQSGTYTYSHADANGCTQVDTLHLNILTPTLLSISGETEVCINQFETYYYDISNPDYHYRWFKDSELWAENVPVVTLHEMNEGSVVLKMQVTDEQSGCDADTSLLVQVVNRIAPDTTEIRRKVNTNILVCQPVYSDYGEVFYRWGYTDLQTSNEFEMPSEHNYCLYEFGIDTLSFRYWVETYLNSEIGEGCENRSYYGHGYVTSVSNYDENIVEAYLSNDRIVLYVNALNPDNISAKLYSVNGKLLLTHDYGNTNQLSEVIPVSIAPGVYLFRISVGNRIYSFKLLKL